MSATIEFIFDFASPNAYLAYRALPPILERTGARLMINPCLLGGIFKATGNVAPGVAFAGVKGKIDYEMLEFAASSPSTESTSSVSTPIFPSTH